MQPKTNHFFNTISADEQLLMVFDAQAKSQEQRVYEIFCEQKCAMAWHQVAAYVPDMDYCSLKRCLSNLATKGKLVKDTDKSNMIIGLKGKPVHKYHLIIKDNHVGITK